MSLDEIIDAYPGLSRKNAVAALEMARAVVEEIGRLAKAAGS
jgi:hypothetical protein